MKYNGSLPKISKIMNEYIEEKKTSPSNNVKVIDTPIEIPNYGINEDIQDDNKYLEKSDSHLFTPLSKNKSKKEKSYEYDNQSNEIKIYYKDTVNESNSRRSRRSSSNRYTTSRKSLSSRKGIKKAPIFVETVQRMRKAEKKEFHLNSFYKLHSQVVLSILLPQFEEPVNFRLCEVKDYDGLMTFIYSEKLPKYYFAQYCNMNRASKYWILEAYQPHSEYSQLIHNEDTFKTAIKQYDHMKCEKLYIRAKFIHNDIKTIKKNLPLPPSIDGEYPDYERPYDPVVQDLNISGNLLHIKSSPHMFQSTVLSSNSVPLLSTDYYESTPKKKEKPIIKKEENKPIIIKEENKKELKIDSNIKLNNQIDKTDSTEVKASQSSIKLSEYSSSLYDSEVKSSKSFNDSNTMKDEIDSLSKSMHPLAIRQNKSTSNLVLIKTSPFSQYSAKIPAPCNRKIIENINKFYLTPKKEKFKYPFKPKEYLPPITKIITSPKK